LLMFQLMPLPPHHLLLPTHSYDVVFDGTCYIACVCGRYDVAELTSVVIYVTQLCCMPFAFDISDVLRVNIQR